MTAATRICPQAAIAADPATDFLITRLAKTHGTVVVEGLDAAGMLAQKGLPGARARRRDLSDLALTGPRRQLRRRP